MNESIGTSPSRRLCAIVPAAGRGTRLGIDVPKVLVPLLPDFTIWNALHRRLVDVADRIVLVLSPDGHDYLDRNRLNFAPGSFDKTLIALQPKPLGMGDAIFCGADLWQKYDDLLIVWGDQFNVSTRTLASALQLHSGQGKPALTFPVVRCSQPYVEYVFDSTGLLTAIRQSREGDACQPGGFSDVGVFLLSGGEALIGEWQRYVGSQPTGSLTGEINFLPFLVHLSTRAHWSVACHEIDDPTEAIGINTPAELELARLMVQREFNRGKAPLP